MTDKKKTFRESMEEQKLARRLKEQEKANDLGDKGEKLLKPNLEKDEKVLAKLKGNFGQGLVVTDRHVFVLKWGYMAGNMFGGRCIGYTYPSITALELKKHATYGLVQILTPATQDNKKLSYWNNNNGNDAKESENAVTFNSSEATTELFQEAVMLARGVMTKMSRGAPVAAANNDLNQLEKLAELRNKGIITEQEFTAKKKQILGL